MKETAVPLNLYVDSSKTLSAGDYYQSYQYYCNIEFWAGLSQTSNTFSSGSFSIKSYSSSSVGGTRSLVSSTYVYTGSVGTKFDSDPVYYWGSPVTASASTPYYNVVITNIGSTTGTVNVFVIAD